MNIDLFDEIVLNDGRTGTITDILDNTHFLVDVGFETWECEEVSADEIKSVSHKQEK